MHAEPTTFGVKLAGFAFEAHRNLIRLERAAEAVSVGALSGAVGTYAANGPEVEEAVLRRLGLAREEVSTQVVPRDRHAELLEAVALAGAGLERFATEVRHLQRTEVREVEEPFRSGAQKGSSAMPHKRNPIVSERIAGIARLLRGYAQAGLENVALWHERDITHSSVERVTLPDATTLLDYAQHLAIRVVEGMTVHEERMRENLNATHGALYSQRALLALVESGRSRDDAYRTVQQAAQRAWDEGIEFRELLAEAAPELDLDVVFDPPPSCATPGRSSGAWTALHSVGGRAAVPRLPRCARVQLHAARHAPHADHRERRPGRRARPSSRHADDAQSDRPGRYRFPAASVAAMSRDSGPLGGCVCRPCR